MVTRIARFSISEKARRAMYSSTVIGVVAGAVAVLGAPWKW